MLWNGREKNKGAIFFPLNEATYIPKCIVGRERERKERLEAIGSLWSEMEKKKPKKENENLRK